MSAERPGPPPDLLAALRTALETEADVRWAYLFGSAARGGAWADVDVAVVPAEGSFPSALDPGRLAARIAPGLPCAVPVDVVDLRAADLPFLANVLDEGVLLVDREPVARRLWEVDVTRRWLDFEPVWSEFRRLRLRRLQEGS